MHVLLPEVTQATRIPSMFPVPTHLAKITQNWTVTVPSSFDTLYIKWFPSAQTYNMLVAQHWLDSAKATTSGVADIEFPIPANYSTYFNVQRLVAASLTIEYIGNALDAAGIISAAMSATYSNNGYTKSAGFISAQADLYDSSQLQDFQFFYQGKVIDGCRVINIPIDSRSYEFSRLGNAINHTSNEWNIRVQGIKSSVSNSFQIRLHQTYEVIPDQDFGDLFTPQLPVASTTQGGKYVGGLQKAIQKYGASSHSKNATTSILDKGLEMITDVDKLGKFAQTYIIQGKAKAGISNLLNEIPVLKDILSFM